LGVCIPIYSPSLRPCGRLVDMTGVFVRFLQQCFTCCVVTYVRDRQGWRRNGDFIIIILFVLKLFLVICPFVTTVICWCIGLVSPPGFSRQAYVLLLLLLSSSFLTIAWSKEISESTRPIFTKFSGLVGCWCRCSICYWFPDWSRYVAMATNFRREIGDTPSFL